MQVRNFLKCSRAISVPGLKLQQVFFCRYSSITQNTDTTDKLCSFNPKRFLLLRKITRYEYEKQHAHVNNEEELKKYLTCKGSNYLGLLQRHDEYIKSLDHIQSELQKRSLDVRIVKRFDYTLQNIDWADVVLSAGGDGTFLNAASKVEGHSKPVIGINTDPIRSEGHLCLPKEYSKNFGEALDKLISGKFKWMWRQRIRLSMGGNHSNDEPINLLEQELMYPEHRFWEHVKENEMLFDIKQTCSIKPNRRLPILALNEVFIGESLSARVSFYELSIDDSLREKQKSSGVTVCTGTGSTSWHFSINHAPEKSVEDILRIANGVGSSKFDVNNKALVEEVTNRFNDSLKFDPRLLKMAYSVRDPITQRVFQVTHPRGFCKKMTIRSRMWDAWVVVDGGISFRFNDGAILYLEMFEEDALRCVTL